MADTLRIGRKDTNDEVTRVPSGESTEDGEISPGAISGAIDKNGRPASYRLQVFTPPEVEGKALWGTFGAEGQDDTPAPSEAPTQRVRYVRSMRRPALAITTGAIAALVFLLGLLVYTRAGSQDTDSRGKSMATPSSPEPAVAATSANHPSPEAPSATVVQHSAPEAMPAEPRVLAAPSPASTHRSAEPAVKPAPPTRSAARNSAAPPAPAPDAGPPATATQPVPTPSGMMIPDPPY